MPTGTYDLIASNVLSSSASSVTFSSIPTTGYRDLIVVCNGTTSAASNLQGRFNSDTGSNYSYVYAAAQSSSVLSGAGTTTTFFIGYAQSGASRIEIAQIMDYSATDKHKTVLTRHGDANVNVGMVANRWANTAAINSVTILTDAGTFNSGYTFYLYGIVG